MLGRAFSFGWLYYKRVSMPLMICAQTTTNFKSDNYQFILSHSAAEVKYIAKSLQCLLYASARPIKIINKFVSEI